MAGDEHRGRVGVESVGRILGVSASAYYPADPATVEELVAIMRCTGRAPGGLRTRALTVPLWRAGLRISEALGVADSDLHWAPGGVRPAREGGKRRGGVALSARRREREGSIRGPRPANWP
jgi:site-specific recombinase XerC